MSKPVIAVSNLHKAYGTLRVLRGVDLEIALGEVFGLLGPNGAGKTTLIHTILGLLRPNAGSVRVFGSHRPDRYNAYLGYLPERQRYHPYFTGREYLWMLGHLSGPGRQHMRQHITTVIDLVGLNHAADRRIGTYSKGMLQRLGLAQALVHKPSLLIIDEPTSGLDPGGQHDIATLLQTLKQHGHTIFVCTHHLASIARLCDRIGVLVDGQVPYQIELEELYRQGHSMTVRVAALPPATADALHALSPHVHCEHAAVVLYPSSDQLLADVLRRLLDDGIAVRSVMPEVDALEQFYTQAIRRQAPTGSPNTDPQQAQLHPTIEDY